MTIFKTLLARGYFPKELPPTFSTEHFADYAVTRSGHQLLSDFRPQGGCTECVEYGLALPGGAIRDLRIPNPATFARLAMLCAKNMRRLLKKAHRSPFSRSGPVYSSTRHRAIEGAFKLRNLARERAKSRAAKTFMLRADISHFYPSLYTHAVGWAIDPKLRERSQWQNSRLLGKRVDQVLMDLQGKVSQGIPIGPDLSFLLAEVVLAQIDRSLKVDPDHAYRWYDDYEIACSTREEAERIRVRLIKALNSYRLRLNPTKTRICSLPMPAGDDWRDELIRHGQGPMTSPDDLVRYFDLAFRLRATHPESPVLQYALAILFKIRCPSPDAGQVGESGITQAVLVEPGAAQKGFALLTFWSLNGLALRLPLLKSTIDEIVLRTDATGVDSDVAWALSFCLQHQVALSSRSAGLLSATQNDCIALLALHMKEEGLLPGAFSHSKIVRRLARVDLDGPHWLLAYESVRQGFLTASAAAVSGHPLFSDLLAKGITFYRRQLPPYAVIVHPGGAPEWVVQNWLHALLQSGELAEQEIQQTPILRYIRDDLGELSVHEHSIDDIIIELLNRLEPATFEQWIQVEEEYR